MNRRAFVTLLSAAVLPFAAQAKQPNKVYRIGVLEQTSAAVHNTYFDHSDRGCVSKGLLRSKTWSSNIARPMISPNDTPASRLSW
jgi:hypothetical protein